MKRACIREENIKRMSVVEIELANEDLIDETE